MAWSTVFPGSGVALLVGMAAAFLGGHYKGSMLLFALLLGMALNFLTEDKRLVLLMLLLAVLAAAYLHTWH